MYVGEDMRVRLVWRLGGGVGSGDVRFGGEKNKPVLFIISKC